MRIDPYEGRTSGKPAAAKRSASSSFQRWLAFEAAAKRRNGARWALALALGLRQGEALGLQWNDVDLEKGTIRIRRSRLRPGTRPAAAPPPARRPHPAPTPRPPPPLPV